MKISVLFLITVCFASVSSSSHVSLKQLRKAAASKRLVQLSAPVRSNDCSTNGGQCVSVWDSCPTGTQITTDYACSGWNQCCLKKDNTGGGGSGGIEGGGSTNTKCGTISAITEARIVGGVEAGAHTWPWQISLQKGYFGGLLYSHICGGTLVDKNTVITAAHCVDKGAASDFKILAGLHDQGDKGVAQTLKVSSIKMHEKWDSTAENGFPNDIAILKLKTSATFNEKVNGACLPQTTQEFHVNHTCYITGWGDTKDTGNKDKLQQLKIDVLTNTDCGSKWGEQYINPGHICVGNGLTGACNGDSGGPLVCKEEGKWHLAGATSWGRTGCQTEGYPSVYTRISQFRAWIDANM